MKRDPVKILGTKTLLTIENIYYLSHISESKLVKHVLSGVLHYNCQENPVFKYHEPLSYFIGGIRPLHALNETVMKIGFRTLGAYSYFKNIKPQELVVLIEKSLEERNTPYLVIAGFNNIAFDRESYKSFCVQVDWLIDRLRVIQEVFKIPIVLSGSGILDFDQDRLVPDFSKYTKIELITDEVHSVSTLDGCRLFRLKNTIE